MSSDSPPGAAGLASRRAGVKRFAPVRAAVRAVLWLLFATWAVLLVGWLSLHWLILPHIEDWRGSIETHASRMLGTTVKIGAISARSSGWVPSLELSDVRVLDAEQRVALSLPRVFAALSPRSVIALEPRFAQLLIDGASLDVRRDKTGRIRVAGLDVAGGGAVTDDDAAADWFFRQREFVIRAGSLRWIDESREAPPLVLSNVDLIVRNGLRDHDLRIDATPPDGWGERFSVRGRFTQALFDKSGDWRKWSGRVYADLPRADLSELKRRVVLPFELSEGDGALRGWFDVAEGQPTKASVELALRAVALRLDAHVEPLEFEQVSGRIEAEKKDDRITVSARRLAFRTGDGLTWPESDVTVAWRQNGGEVVGGDVDADRLDVGVMADIATRVPLGAALRELLADVKPRGRITELRTHWDGPLDSPTHYRVKGLLSDLALTARPSSRAADAIGRPGVQNASIQLDASDTGGQAQVTVRAGRIDLPGVLEDPQLMLDRLDARLAWKIDEPSSAAPKVTVKVGPASFANADAKGDLTATWRTGHGPGAGRGGRYPGELELDGHVMDAAAVRLARYLPLGLPDGVRSYIGRAVRAGTVDSATFRVRGDLADFPFHDPKVARDGEFRIAAKVAGVTFAYSPGETSAAGSSSATPGESWPPITAASGEIVVDRTALDLRDVKAQLLGVEWTGLQGRIAEMGSKGRLDLEGTGRGALAEMLRFVETTPIGRWTGRALSTATATGPAELKLTLAMPLAHVSDTTVKGSLALAGNDVRMTPDTPLLGGAKARVDFSQKGFTVNAGTARVLGGELAFDGGSSAGLAGGDTQRFSGRGTFTAEALRQANELGTVVRFASFATGQSTYRASLAFVGGRPQVSVASNLVGMAIDLPAPLAKAAPTPLPLRIRTGPAEAAPGAPAETPNRDALQVDYGGLVQAHFVRESSGDTSRVVRGAIRVVDARPATSERAAVEPMPLDPIEPVSLPATGVAANVAVKKLDVDVWEGVLARFQGDPAPARPGTTASPTSGPTAPLVFDSGGGTGYVPTAIALRVGDLVLGSRRLANVTAGLSQQADLWRANVDADELAGYVEYRPARRGTASAGAGRVFARLSRLSLPKGEAERVESLLDEQPASIPALDVVVEDFELRGKRLGRLEIEAVNRAAGSREAAREWQLSKLNLTMPEAQFAATGTWGGVVGPGAPAGARRASMSFTLALADSGALLDRLGMNRVVKGGKGSLTGDVAWPGSPFSPDYAKMTGQVKVAIDSGQFLKAGPGAARLLGVLSLQSLQRRLLLDFRDVFAEGFAFDNVVGDVRIGQGLASTNNLRMRGAAAAVLMEGSADLEHETEDLRVVVVPEINAGTASLAYAVINPAIGLGTFLAQYFLRKPLMAASTREFRVTGPWDDPKVDRVDRSLLGEAARTDPAAPGTEPSPAATR